MSHHHRKGLSAPALNQIYGGHGNIIAWGGIPNTQPPVSESPPRAAALEGAAPPAPLLHVSGPQPTAFSSACADPPGIAYGAAAPTTTPLPVSGASTVATPDAVRAAAAALVPDLTQGHHTFTRVMALRLTEIRELRSVWQSSGGLDALLATICETCHESVAVDVYHALASYRGTGSGGPQLVGGFPRWSWPRQASIAWLSHVAPVLETLLFSVIEDYLVTATVAVGSVQDALSGLWTVAVRCSPRDLRLGIEDGEEEEKGGSDDSASGDVGALAAGGAECRHAAAVQAVEAVSLTMPLLAALRHAAQYRGRIQKATTARLDRLVEMHAAVERLVTAVAAAPSGFL